MQHDTSPHEVERGGKKRKVQTASSVLCYSRMLFFQCYPTFRRFDCKVFLADALRYMGGATARVMIDNTHVVVLRGSRRDMVPVPELAAFRTDDGEPTRTPAARMISLVPPFPKNQTFGVDYGPVHFIPVLSRVLGVGDLTRTLLGRFCQAPKGGGVFATLRITDGR
jgi:hypothetical protein